MARRRSREMEKPHALVSTGPSIAIRVQAVRSGTNVKKRTPSADTFHQFRELSRCHRAAPCE